MIIHGPSGADQLLSSVSERGARYFDAVTEPSGKPARLLTVIPLADALTLPVCSLRTNVVVVPAFHGGLLGDGSVLRGQRPPGGPPGDRAGRGRAARRSGGDQQRGHRSRMPVAHPACPG